MRLGHRYYDASAGRFLSRDPIQDGYNGYTRELILKACNPPTSSVKTAYGELELAETAVDAGEGIIPRQFPRSTVPSLAKLTAGPLGGKLLDGEQELRKLYEQCRILVRRLSTGCEIVG